MKGFVGFEELLGGGTPAPARTDGEWDLDVDPSTLLPAPGGMTLAEAQQLLLEALGDGAPCPCCSKRAHRDKRTLNRTMASALCWLVQQWEGQGNVGWIDVPKRGPQWMTTSNQHSTLRWWGLIERRENSGDPTKKHTGHWRPTKRGVDFIRGLLTVPGAVFSYLGVPLQFDTTKMVTLDDVLGVDFDYRDAAGPNWRVR